MTKTSNPREDVRLLEERARELQEMLDKEEARPLSSYLTEGGRAKVAQEQALIKSDLSGVSFRDVGKVEDLLTHIIERGDQARAVAAVHAMKELAPEEFRSAPYKDLREALEYVARGSYHAQRIEGHKAELKSLERSIQDMHARAILDKKDAAIKERLMERTTRIPLGDQGGRVRVATARKAGSLQPLD